MRRMGIALAAATMLAVAESVGQAVAKSVGQAVERSYTARVDRIKGVKKTKLNTTANAINVFYGYASERKGKGQKKREASARRAKGW